MAKIKKAKSGKRSNGDGSIRQRKDGSWEARVTVGVDPGTGKPIRKSIYGKKQEDVAIKLRKITQSIDEGNYMEPSKLTVKGWFQIWLKDFQSESKPLTIRQYESMCETHIFPALGAVKLSKLSTMQLTRFYNQLAVDGKTAKRKNVKTGRMEVVKTGEPLSPKSILNIHCIISKALNTAIENRILKENVATYAKVPKVIQDEVKPLTQEEQIAFLDEIKSHRFNALFQLALFTGLREGELLGLTWNCIDWKTGVLMVYRQLQRVPGSWSEFRFVPLKNSKTRYIQLSPYVISLLKKHETEQLKKRFAAGELWQGFQSDAERKEGLVFTDDLGRNLNPQTVFENFKKIATKIGRPDARVHDLRHSFAVNSLQCGDDYKTLQNNLGHATAAFSMNRYGHVSEKMHQEHARRQEEYIKSLGLQA